MCKARLLAFASIQSVLWFRCPSFISLALEYDTKELLSKIICAGDEQWIYRMADNTKDFLPSAIEFDKLNRLCDMRTVEKRTVEYSWNSTKEIEFWTCYARLVTAVAFRLPVLQLVSRTTFQLQVATRFCTMFSHIFLTQMLSSSQNKSHCHSLDIRYSI